MRLLRSLTSFHGTTRFSRAIRLALIHGTMPIQVSGAMNCDLGLFRGASFWVVNPDLRVGLPCDFGFLGLTPWSADDQVSPVHGCIDWIPDNEVRSLEIALSSEITAV